MKNKINQNNSQIEKGDNLSVPKGYKQTEVGVIPEDWMIEELKNISELATGTTPPTKDPSNYGDEFLFVGPGDLGKTKWVSKTAKKLSSKGFSISRKFPANSVLVTCIGSTIGKSSMSNIELTSNQQINAIFPNGNSNNEFIYYQILLNSEKLRRSAGEQAVPLLNKNKFGEFKIPLPPTLTEQTAIATALSDMDSLIEGLEKLIAKKQNIKQGAMQELLTPYVMVNGEWLMVNGKPKMKEGWVKLTLKEIGKFSSSSVDKIFRKEDEEVYLLNYMDVYNNTVLRKNKINGKTTANKTQIKNFGLIKGDIVFTPTSETPNDIGRAALISNNLNKTVFSYHVVRFRFFCDVIVDILKPYVLNCQQLSNYFHEKATGSTRYVLKKSDFENAPIRIPKDKKEQTHIAQILSSMDTEISELETQLSKYKQLKTGMMQELLTGKKRLI